MRTVMFLLSGSLAASACMVAPMDHGSGQMTSDLSSARDETSHHADVCGRAATMTDVTRESQRHGQAMAGILDRMDGAMGSMHDMKCTGSHMDSMMGTFSTMRTTLADHQSHMAAIDDVAKAHDECASYRDDMLGLCTSARQDNDAMGCM